MAPRAREAVILLLDIGHNTLQPSGNEGQTFFERAKHCVMKIILRKIFSSPTDEIGVILFGCKETENSLNASALGFDGIVEMGSLQIATWDMLRKLDKVEANDKDDGVVDWSDAVLVALNYAKEETEAKTFNNIRIILLSNFLTECQANDLDVIVESVGEVTAELIGVSDTVQYDDTENLTGCHFTQSDNKNSVQTKSEKIFAGIIGQMENAQLCHIDYVESQLLYYQRKIKKPYPWNCQLTIGSEYKINTSAYVYTKEEGFFESFKMECLEENTFAKLTTTYRRNNEEINKPDEHDIVRAYMYGKQICPVDEDMKYDGGKKCLSCIAFCKKSCIPPKYNTGDGCHIVVPQVDHKKASQLFSVLIKAMLLKNCVIVARKIYRDNTKPHLVQLIPHCEDAGMYFVMIELPYEEDVIYTQFPPLKSDKYKTTDEQAAAMDELLSKMDLTNAVDDESGVSEHSVTLNPVQQHMCNAVAYRALNPGEPLPQFDEELKKLFDVPPKIKKESQAAIDMIENLFKLEVVHEKVKKPFGLKKKETDTNENIEMESDSEISSERKGITKVGTVTPAEDFLYLIKYSGDRFSNLCDQIQGVIYDFIFRVTTDFSEKAKETIMAYREVAKCHAPFQYNKWVREFKDSMMKRNKMQQWTDIFTAELLGLITINESPISTVTIAEQAEFYKIDMKNTTAPTEYGIDEEDELAGLLGM